MMNYLIIFLLSFLISCVAVILVKKLAIKLDITDKPGDSRKIHKKPIPLLGGIAIYVSFFIVVLVYYYSAPDGWPQIVDLHVNLTNLLGFLTAGFFLMIGGFLDDKYNLKPYQQIIWPILAVVAIIASGIGVEKITNPFGGFIYLDQIKIFLYNFNGIDHFFVVYSDLLTFFWLMTVIYTTKFLDGLDGLVSGITVIGSIIIAVLSLFFFINYPTALLAVILAGCYSGFLVFNFNPAKIFLGEAGSTLAGLMLGVLAIISGAKLATTVLVLGLPILDAVWVIARRVFWEKRSPFQADRKHLHFRLLDSGLSQRKTVAIIYLLSASFGLAALFMQSQQKIYGLVFLVLVMIVLASTVLIKNKS